MDHRDAVGQQSPPRAASPSRRASSERQSGPRQEYLDAFGEDEFGTYSPPEGRRGRAAHRATGASGPKGSKGEPRPRNARGPAGQEPGQEDGAAADGRAGGGWGRALTGVVAAAVVTVLAVITAVEVADSDPDPSSDLAAPAELGQPQAGPEGDPGGAAGQARPGPEAPTGEPGGPGGSDGASEAPAEPGFAELMGSTFEMDPELTGDGRLVPVGGSSAPEYPDAATVLRYRVDVEAGVGLDEEFFAEAVHRTLGDPRGWAERGELSFTRVSGGDYDFIITLASPGTTADWCARSGLDTTEDNVSCNSSSTDRVMINAWRWAQGSETYGEDIRGYRQMLINHEVGHRLGWGHADCPAEGEPAPVMMQQTKYLTTDGVTCHPNPWPNPER